MANEKKAALRVGMTTNLERDAKKNEACGKLIYYEMFSDHAEAARRTDVIKKWCTAWESRRPEKRRFTWDDLYEELLSGI
ncbi:hypothetical protein HZA43_01490 [Candidatus Peregrinibacteria bacterium]|nr:hypothetical protein [Candidatus Peregrinibacteria bacterium]